MSADVVFFGVAAGTGAGHYFFLPGQRGFALDRDLPLPPSLVRHPSPDGRWCFPAPRTPEQMRNGFPRGADDAQGRSFIHFVDGWTIIAWWDRSEDTRRGSNAVFFVRGRHPWAVAVAQAREAFPRELARMERAYPLGLAGTDLLDGPEADLHAHAHREAERLRTLHPDVLNALRGLMGWGP